MTTPRHNFPSCGLPYCRRWEDYAEGYASGKDKAFFAVVHFGLETTPL